MARLLVHHGLRSALGLVFVASGLVKLTDVSAFASHVADFGIVADGLVLVTAWGISLAELLVGLGLLANRRGSLLVVFTLLVVFCGVLTYGLALGLDIDCGCLGPALSLDLRTQLAIDAVLLTCCILVHTTRRRTSVDAANSETADHAQPEEDTS